MARHHPAFPGDREVLRDVERTLDGADDPGSRFDGEHSSGELASEPIEWLRAAQPQGSPSDASCPEGRGQEPDLGPVRSSGAREFDLRDEARASARELKVICS